MLDSGERQTMRRLRSQLAKASVIGLVGVGTACRGEQVGTSQLAARASAATGAIIDLGVEEERAELITGFHAPEVVERRKASWSDGDSSQIEFSLAGSAKRHFLALLGEPYFAIQPVAIKASLNGKELGSMKLDSGWKGYGLVVDSGIAQEGRNALTLQYSKTGRPSAIEASSTDSRELSVRIDEIQMQPVTERVRLVFDMNNAFSRAALAEGWAVDANDASPGLWSVGPRAALVLHLEPVPGKDYRIELTAHSQGGVTEQTVQVRLNQSALGSLTFSQRKSTQKLAIPAAALRDRNDLVFEIRDPKSPAAVDPKSSDQRLLGIRALKLELMPHEVASGQSAGK